MFLRAFKSTFIFIALSFFLAFAIPLQLIAQEQERNIVQLKSKPVSFTVLKNSEAVNVESNPVSYSIEESPSLIMLISSPVAFNVSDSAPSVMLSSDLVSYSTTISPSSITLTSEKVSFILNEYLGDKIQLTSLPVSLSVSNDKPLISSVIPNLIPVSMNELDFKVLINGENLTKDSLAVIGSKQLPTDWLSSKELITYIPASLLSTINDYELYVVSPSANNTVSEGYLIKVVEPIPIAKVKASPSIGVVPQVVTFDASSSSDLLAGENGLGLKYSWNFKDQFHSEDNPNTSSNEIISHRFDMAGIYEVELEVENEQGYKSLEKKQIEIRDKNNSPIVNADYTILEKASLLEVTFDASNSFDLENDDLSFTWDFGDGVVVETTSLVSHEYSKEGAYSPVLIVKDSLGAVTKKYFDPIEYLGPNSPPVAIINVSPTKGVLMNLQSGQNELLIMFSAKDSFDKDGEIINYEWEIKDTSNSTPFILMGKEVEHSFNKPGVYEVLFKAIDDRKMVTEKKELISVLKPLPKVSASTDVSSGPAPLKVSFSSSGTEDFDGFPVSVTWNFGDGSELTSGENPIHIYNKPGIYLPTITVIALDGRKNVVNAKPITVEEFNGPISSIKIVEGTTKGVSGESVIKLIAEGDLNSDSSLSYEWKWIAHKLDDNKNLIDITDQINVDFEEGELKDSNKNKEFTYAFKVDGQYTPVLKIIAGDGRASEIHGETITVLPGQLPVAVANIISSDLKGEGALEVKYDASMSFDPKSNGVISSYLWDFGDGSTSVEISPVHSYSTPGSYNAKLTIVDNRGLTSTAFAHTVKVLPVEELASRLFSSGNELTKKILNQEFVEELGDGLSYRHSEEKPIDTIPPNISIFVENPLAVLGEDISFNAHITDDFGVELIGYSIIDENKNVVIEVLEDVVGNNRVDVFMSNVDYMKTISTKGFNPGKYKLRLFAKDFSGNWVGKESSIQQISTDLEILKKENDLIAYSPIIVESTNSSTLITDMIYEEIKDLLHNETLEEQDKLIELIAFEKVNTLPGEPAPIQELSSSRVKARNEKDSSTSLLAKNYKRNRDETPQAKFRGAGIINYALSRPSIFGVPRNLTIANTIVPITSNINSNLQNIAVALGIQTGAKNYNSISISPTVVIPAVNEPPKIEKHFTISCAPGRDCSIYDDRLKELNGSTYISVSGQNQDGTFEDERFFEIDKEDLEPEGKRSPEITSLSVSERIKGSGAFYFDVNGSMFNTSSKVVWNGNELDTTFKNSKKLVAHVPAWFTSEISTARIKVKKKYNGKSFYSNVKQINIKKNGVPYFVFDAFPGDNEIIEGASDLLNRSGGNVFISDTNTTFKEAGSVKVPFVLERNAFVEVEVVGALINTSVKKPQINFYHNNFLKGLLVKEDNKASSNKSWKLDLGELPVGGHTVKLALPSLDGKSIYILDKIIFKFKSNETPVVTSIKPGSILPENNLDRELTIFGKGFGESPKLIYNDLSIDLERVKENEFKAKLPEALNLQENISYFPIAVLNNESNLKSKNVSVGVRNAPSVLETISNYKFFQNNLTNTGPTSVLDVTVKPEDKNAVLESTFVVVSDEGDLIVPKQSYPVKGDMKASFDLPYDLSVGSYHVLSYLKNDLFGITTDFSSAATKKFIDDLSLGKINNKLELAQRLSEVPVSHKDSFFIEEQVAVQLQLTNVLTSNSNNFIQENQEFNISFDVKSNLSDTSGLKLNLDFSDGTVIQDLSSESVIKHSYKLLENKQNNQYFISATLFRDGEVLGSSSKNSIFVYKDLLPVPIVKIEDGIFQGDIPFKTNFIDHSFDPNNVLNP